MEKMNKLKYNPVLELDKKHTLKNHPQEDPYIKKAKIAAKKKIKSTAARGITPFKSYVSKEQ